MNMDSLPWNKKLQVLRAIKDWSQDDAANECGTNQKMYWRWEKGLSYPRNNSRRAIASGFGVPQSEIFGAQDDKKAG